MVVPSRADAEGEYRKFKIKGVDVQDDFARRCRDVVVRADITRRWPTAVRFRISIVIDGGKGQLSAAYEALRESASSGSWRSAGQGRGTDFHARSPRGARAARESTAAASAAADSRRGAPVRRHFPPAIAREA
jgi:hypothetical protein